MLSDCFGWPVCVCCDYSYSRAIRLTNKRVRATFIVYCYDLKLCRWQPLQGRSQIARPNAPPGSIFKLDNMTLIVGCDQHSRQRPFALRAIVHNAAGFDSFPAALQTTASTAITFYRNTIALLPCMQERLFTQNQHLYSCRTCMIPGSDIFREQ
jgi:hypothetical protein